MPGKCCVCLVLDIAIVHVVVVVVDVVVDDEVFVMHH